MEGKMIYVVGKQIVGSGDWSGSCTPIKAFNNYENAVIFQKEYQEMMKREHIKHVFVGIQCCEMGD